MSDVTNILSAIESGDPHAGEKLLPLIYEELRKLAAQKLSHEAAGQTLQAIPAESCFRLQEHSGREAGAGRSASRQLRGVARYDGNTGRFLDVFTESGHLTSPRGIVFGLNGDLYVSDATDGASGAIVGRVVRFDGSTGKYLGDFVAAAYGGLGRPGGLLFGPNGRNDGKLDLYVASAGNNRILRYDGDTGQFLGEFVSGSSGWLDHETSLTFGPDGNLYVANWAAGVGHSAVLRFQGPNANAPGTPMPSAGKNGADFIAPGTGGLLAPVGVIFGPDGNGDNRLDLYVSSSEYHGGNALNKENTGTVKRFDGVTGAYIDTFIDAGSGGLREPFFMTFTETDPVTLAYHGVDGLIAADLPSAPAQQTLTIEQVQPFLTESLARWQAAGVTSSALGITKIEIADLGGSTVRLAFNNSIWLDDNAAGWGWFVDPTLDVDFEFVVPGDQSAKHRVDLLTVLMHELGHLLG